MIPNTHSYEAVFRHKSKDTGEDYSDYLPVIAWDDNGTAMVISRKSGGLVRVTDYPNFVCIREGEGRAVAVIPGCGYVVEYDNGDGTTFTSPVLAWVINDLGYARAISVDSSLASADTVNDSSNFKGVYLPADSTQEESKTDV
jgi:hypothetical protein